MEDMAMAKVPYKKSSRGGCAIMKKARTGCPGPLRLS
jgi:hypothetical protein